MDLEPEKKPHALCIPVPVQGHINPMLKLAKILHSKGFLITFVNTEFNHQRLVRSRGVEAIRGLPSFRFETIPDGLPPPQNLNATQDLASIARAIEGNFLDPFKRLVAKVGASCSPVTCIVADLIMGFTHAAGSELGVPVFLLWTSGAGYFRPHMERPPANNVSFQPAGQNTVPAGPPIPATGSEDQTKPCMAEAENSNGKRQILPEEVPFFKFRLLFSTSITSLTELAYLQRNEQHGSSSTSLKVMLHENAVFEAVDANIEESIAIGSYPSWAGESNPTPTYGDQGQPYYGTAIQPRQQRRVEDPHAHLMAAYPHTQFPPGTATTRFASLRGRLPHRTTVIDWDFLEVVGERERAEQIIGVDTPWSRLFTCELPAYRELTVEFYSTFIFTPRDDDDNDDDDDDEEQPERYEVYFSMFGDPHHMTLAQFAVHSGLYTEEETAMPIYTEGIHHTPDDQLRAFWPAIGYDAHTANTSSASIRDPLYRYLHRLISCTIAGRKEGTDRCNLRDLFLLRCLLTRNVRHCNLARCLADYFAGYYHRQYRGALLGGPYITAIAQSLGHYMDIVDLRIPPILPLRAGRLTCDGMHILGRFDGGRVMRFVSRRGQQPYVPVSLIEPPPLAAPKVIIEQGFEGDDEAGGVHHDPPHVGDGPPPPPQYVPRTYQAVRLPVEVTDRLGRMEDGQMWMQDTMTWMVRRMTEQLSLDGRQFPLPSHRFDHQAGPSGTVHEAGPSGTVHDDDDEVGVNAIAPRVVDDMLDG
ncbi:hypothetical protein SSX86_000515 [Deinandra increscens subsp. villosa]|uniref:Glycosyltransferase N-terminal domain-containing protein n=1 Tax=Deinandra increscens subsp. villosa TaxID=3103831 RepID=A0AAP0HDM4_9ASTR